LVERLSEPPARLLEPEGPVERMRVLAALRGRQEQQYAAALPRQALRERHQLLADALAPRRLVDDDRPPFRDVAVVFERARDVDRDQADHRSFALGYPDLVVGRGRQGLQPPA